MSILCLSLAATLRCTGIPKTESIVLLVPPAIEALVSLFFIRTVWRNGRKRWLLVAEAWIFLLLTILDFASHAAVRASPSLTVFKPLDNAVGALSFVPLVLYMSFLFLLTRADLLPLVRPASLRTIFQFAIFSFIPPVVMTNELGSLLGISYRVRPTDLGPVAEIGFLSATSKALSTAFTDATVVVLAVFQLLIFLLCTWHISRAWASNGDSAVVFQPAPPQRQRSNSHSSSYLGDEQGVRGLSWLALALALGVAETFIAFAPQGFSVVLARRILRVLARGFLLYALVRGSSDGFSNIGEETPAMAGAVRSGGIRGLISNPRLSTFAHLTPNATAFYNARQGPRPANANPFADPVSDAGSPHTRVTVLYDQKSAPVLQMRFSGLDVPDSSRFSARSIRSNSTATQITSVAGHAGHSTHTGTPARSRTLSEKRAGPPLASITIPEIAVLAGVTATQSASTISSLPYALSSSQSLPQAALQQPARTLAIGSVQRSSTRSSSNVSDSLDGVQQSSNQFSSLPPRVTRRGPTQLAYAVQEEDEPLSSRSRSRSRSHARTDTAESNVSTASVLSSGSRRKPVPAHTPRGTIIGLPQTDSRRPSIPQTDSGEEVAVEAHSALFPDVYTVRDYNPDSPHSSARSSSMSDITTTLTATAPTTGSPEQLRRPGRLAERVVNLERKRSDPDAERRDVERNWMRRSRPITTAEIESIMPGSVPSRVTVVSRTPEILTTGTDHESVRAELEGMTSPKSAWSAKVPWGSTVGEPSQPTAQTPRTVLGLPANPRAGRPGANVEGWGRKTSDSKEVPTLKGLVAEEEKAGSSNWRQSEVLGRLEGELVRRSLVSSYSGPNSSNASLAGDEAHAM